MFRERLKDLFQMLLCPHRHRTPSLCLPRPRYTCLTRHNTQNCNHSPPPLLFSRDPLAVRSLKLMVAILKQVQAIQFQHLQAILHQVCHLPNLQLPAPLHHSIHRPLLAQVVLPFTLRPQLARTN